MEGNVEKAGKGQEVEERTLFHGTRDFETVRGICINNFDHRECGENDTMHGKGAYFATTARYSDQFTSPPERYLFLARVLVGEYTKSDPSYTRPPPKPGTAHDLYDSCVDNVDDPTIFVIFNTKQCYPEFVIKYICKKDSTKQRDSSDFIGTVNRKNTKKPVPPSAKDKDSEKMSKRQAGQDENSSKICKIM